MTSFIKRYLRRKITGTDLPLFAPVGVWASPYTDPDEVEKDAARLFDPQADLGPSIALRDPEQLALLAELGSFADEFNWPEFPRAGSRYFLNNELFNPADGLALYAMMRRFHPKRIVEVGSGFSSGLMLDTDERHLGRSVRFTFIEPYPEVRLEKLLQPEDRNRCKVLAVPVQQAPADVFTQLEAGDMLFIDSSHVAKAGSDLNRLLFEVVPQLPAGVLIHFHDIQWPFEYPSAWHRQLRGWNEIYVLRAFLQYNAAFSMIFWGGFLAARHPETVKQHLPALVAHQPGSLWIRKDV